MPYQVRGTQQFTFRFSGAISVEVATDVPEAEREQLAFDYARAALQLDPEPDWRTFVGYRPPEKGIEGYNELHISGHRKSWAGTAHLNHLVYTPEMDLYEEST